MKKKKKAAGAKPAEKEVKKITRKKAAAPRAAAALPPDCECRKASTGKWYRYVRDSGTKKRIPPAFNSREDCEASCEGE